MAKQSYIVIPGTNIRLYDGDTVKISNKPKDTFIVHTGWYMYQGAQQYGWYMVSVNTAETLPVYIIDLTLCTLESHRIINSETCDGPVVNYTKPFTDADAEILNRTFISVDTIAQRDNIDPKTLTEGRLIRVNDVDGKPAYYSWDSINSEWLEITNNAPTAADVSYEPPESGTTSGSTDVQSAIDALNDAISGGDKEVFYGTTAYWNSQPQFIPIRGCIYIYSDHDRDDQGNNIPGIKIGDGTSYLIDMPFTDKKYAEHITDTLIHVSPSDRAFWDGKVRCFIDPTDLENLVFTTE